MELTSTTCGDHLARKSWREADWDGVILHVVHKSLGPLGMIPQGADTTQRWMQTGLSLLWIHFVILKEYLTSDFTSGASI